MTKKGDIDPLKKQATNRFRPGQSGNPAGRPVGALSRSSRLAANLLDGEAEGLARKAVELALGGDVVALRLCLERLLPPARERSIEVGFPILKTASDLPAAISGVLSAVGSGAITPSEGQRLAGLLGSWREAVELADLEARVAALEGMR